MCDYVLLKLKLSIIIMYIKINNYFQCKNCLDFDEKTGTIRRITREGL